MPELPEVETVVRGLRKSIQSKTIGRVRLNNPPWTMIETGNAVGKKSFTAALKNKTIESISRRGKNILIHLSGELTLWTHLKMTGHFFSMDINEPVGKHDLVIFEFIDKRGKTESTTMRYNDYRRFGRLRLFGNDELWEQKGLASLGPEPLEIKAGQFVDLFKNKKRILKSALLDQSFIAGIGNIYADETLFLSRLHPRRLCSSISKKKLIELHGHIQTILKFSISKMGSSIDSFSGVNGKPGQFQKYLKAYGKEGEPCDRCAKTIVREKIGQRSAHYCPRCQRLT